MPLLKFWEVFSLYLGVGSLIFLGLTWVVRRVHRELESLVDLAANSSCLVPENFGIAEFHTLAQTLCAHLKARQEEAKTQGVSLAMHMVAHDFRKPFSQLKYVCECLETTTTTQGLESLKSLATPALKRSISSVETILRDLKDVGQLPKIKLRDYYAQEAFLEILDQFQLELQNKKLSVELSLSAHLVWRVDPGCWNRLLGNLLSNAIAATEKGGKFYIKSLDCGDYHGFAITNGPAWLPLDQAKTVFDPFVSYRKINGSGLGLAIAKRIVEAHEGSVECLCGDAREVTFRVLVPRKTLPGEIAPGTLSVLSDS